MLEISTDLQVNQPVITVTSNTFISIENYLSILEYEVDLIRIKTKVKTIKISGDKLSLKYITEDVYKRQGYTYAKIFVIN